MEKKYEIDVTYVGKVFYAFVNPTKTAPVAIIRFFAYYKIDNLTGIKTDMQNRRMRSMILTLEGATSEMNIYSLKPGDIVSIRERFERREEYPGSCLVTNLSLDDEPYTYFNAKGVWD